MADLSPAAPRLLLVAHGTASPHGSATTARVADAVRAARPSVAVDLAFLDVARPRLADALDETPTVVVPLLLSTGYHVQTDIPAAVAAYPRTLVARHLGPHPLLADALADRLALLAEPSGPTVLVGAGSSRAEAADELAEMAALLATRLDVPVDTATVGPALADNLRALRPARVAAYLLAEGQFTDALASAARGLAPVSPPIGVHPALVRLVWARYDEAGPSGAAR